MKSAACALLEFCFFPFLQRKCAFASKELVKASCLDLPASHLPSNVSLAVQSTVRDYVDAEVPRFDAWVRFCSILISIFWVQLIMLERTFP